MPTFPASGSAGPLLDAALGYARAALGADRAVIWAWPSAVGEPQLAAQCGCAADQAGAASLVTTVLETPEGRWSLEAFFVDVAIGEHERAGARELASLLATAIDAGAAERRMLDAELVAERRARQQHVAAEHPPLGRGGSIAARRRGQPAAPAARRRSRRRRRRPPATSVPRRLEQRRTSDTTSDL